MGFVIAFPGSTMRRRPNAKSDRPIQAEITIFPGVRYERYPAEAPKRTEPKSHRIFLDTLPQPS